METWVLGFEQWLLLKKILYILSYPKKNTQIYKILQYLSISFYILKSSHDSLLYVFIIYCECNYDNFILLSLYDIFVFMQLWLYICQFVL